MLDAVVFDDLDRTPASSHSAERRHAIIDTVERLPHPVCLPSPLAAGDPRNVSTGCDRVDARCSASGCSGTSSGFIAAVVGGTFRYAAFPSSSFVPPCARSVKSSGWSGRSVKTAPREAATALAEVAPRQFLVRLLQFTSYLHFLPLLLIIRLSIIAHAAQRTHHSVFRHALAVGAMPPEQTLAPGLHQARAATPLSPEEAPRRSTCRRDIASSRGQPGPQ
jgi:hypothetical protein